MSRSEIPAPRHAAGDHVAGFDIDAVTPVADLKLLAYECTHRRTGAKVLHLHANDEENLFSVGFRTPPEDSTGVAHILEHSVLAGSRRFPVKDAFNELQKRSLATYLNAATWPDRTVYPVCSAVRADYFNLASVYADLVFNPLLKRETFLQEGHHLEPAEGEDPPLRISGVVFNEMKGVYSAPEQLAFRLLDKDLLPDTVYAHDSGGDPAAIPDLTYEQFVAFHRRHYAPANARFLLYGDVPLAENLGFIDRVLRPLAPGEPAPVPAPQPPWDAPRSATHHYAVGPEDATAEKTFVVVAWVANETVDMDETLVLDIAMEALVGSAAGPLRKALVDSGLGQDLFPGSAYSAGMRQALLHVGLRGSEPEHAEAIERLVLDTVRRVAAEGIDRELLEAAFHQIEFHGREISPPFPVMLMSRAATTWYYEGDPKEALAFGSRVQAIRERFAAEPRLFEDALRRWLLDNPHRLRFVLAPSRSAGEERAVALARRLRALAERLTPEELARIREEAEALARAQRDPDSPDHIERLPRLTPADIPREPKEVPTHVREEAGVTILEHPVFSNGIGYVSLALDARDLDDEAAILLPLTGRATLGMGAAGLDYEAMATRIATTTGGLGYGTTAGLPLRATTDDARFERFIITGSALRRNAGPLFDLLGDLLREPDPSDRKRLRDLVLQAFARARSRVIPAGHSFAHARAAARLSHAHWRTEQWSGLTQLAFLREQAAGGEDAVARLVERIGALQRRLFSRRRLLVSVAGDPEVLDALRPPLSAFLAALPAGEEVRPAPPRRAPLPPASAVAIPAEVCYVAEAVPVPRMPDPMAPLIDLAAEALSSEYLYKRIRVEGGAYGGSASYQATSGVLAFTSYRDPHLYETLDVFEGSVRFLERDMDDAMIDAIRVGAIGALDRVLAPASALAVARARHLLGIRHEDRRAFREGLFSGGAARIRHEVVPLLAERIREAPRAALGGADAIARANERLPSPLSVTTLDL